MGKNACCCLRRCKKPAVSCSPALQEVEKGLLRLVAKKPNSWLEERPCRRGIGWRGWSRLPILLLQPLCALARVHTLVHASHTYAHRHKEQSGSKYSGDQILNKILLSVFRRGKPFMNFSLHTHTPGSQAPVFPSSVSEL